MKKNNYRQRYGAWGEHQAEKYLIDKGLRTLERNYRTAFGEIDLVMSQDSQLVFVEVKTRSSKRFGWPEESVTDKKTDHLLLAVEQYLADHPEALDAWRVDVISICGTPGGSTPEITWFENALG